MSTTNCISRPVVPSGALEPTTNAMLEFDGFYFWTNYSYNAGGYTGYWFNNQQWDPRNAFVDQDGLHLQLKRTAIPIVPTPSAPPYDNPAHWSSIEILLWGTTANNPNVEGTPPVRSYPGFGTYLVAAKTSGSFNDISQNCCFGVFTYQFEADTNIINQHRELDMLECSIWNNPGIIGNAQFTLQPWGDQSDNIHRITLQDSGEITLVMNWPGEGVPVTYSVYYGLFDLASLPASPDITWTTGSDQNTYIPNEGCQSLHLNMWRQPQDYDPSGPQEVIIKKVQFQGL